MISEIKFINDYNSFWDSLTPMLTKYVMMVNRTGAKKNGKAYSGPVSSGDRGVVNEAAYLLAKNVHEGNTNKTLIDKCIRDAKNFIINERGDAVSGRTLKTEVIFLSNSIQIFTKKFEKEGNLVYQPHFKGCALLNSCSGDISTNDTIIEVKAGDRAFRGADFKQVTTYSFLKYLEFGSTFRNVCIFNPRRAIFFKVELAELIYDISGHTYIDFFEELKLFLEGIRISK